jgi:heme exporter protein D
LENFNAREWTLAAVTAVSAAVMAWMSLRQKNRAENRTLDQQERQQTDARADQIEANTIGQWKVLYFQKCEETTQTKTEYQTNANKLTTELGTLKDQLMAERIKRAEAETDLKRCRLDLRELRKRRGVDDPDDGSDEG